MSSTLETLFPHLATTILGLPHLPGVYTFYDANHRLLYVGKAIDLHKRVRSYFVRHQPHVRIAAMVKQVHHIEVTLVQSETEALLLESTLIKVHKPRYNILFRDDKTYPYVMLSQGKFPRLSFYRGKKEEGGHYFGPYPHAQATRHMISTVQKLFRLRTCPDAVFKRHTQRPCLLYQLGRCTAPCVGSISPADYAEYVKCAVLFLQGRNRDMIGALRKKMRQDSDNMDYEQAAHSKNILDTLFGPHQEQHVVSRQAIDADVIACARNPSGFCITVVRVRAGSVVKQDQYFPAQYDLHDLQDDFDLLAAFLSQQYCEQQTVHHVILSPYYKPRFSELAVLLSRTTHFMSAVRGHRKAWFDLAMKNAKFALSQHTAGGGTQPQQAGTAVCTFVGLPGDAQRFDCFDVSHTMGESTVGSCVVYDKGQLMRRACQLYSITGLQAGDDYAAMTRLIQLHYQKKTSLPDLVIVDGGQGQVHAAVRALRTLQMDTVLVIGLAKGPSRRVGQECIFFSDNRPPQSLDVHYEALLALAAMRDEAHRLAITSHRRARHHRTLLTPLREIPGIGTRLEQRILSHFTSLHAVQKASVEDIAAVSGISVPMARRIYDALHH